MRIVLAMPFLRQEPTTVAILGGLAKAYRAQGHSVLICGQVWHREKGRSFGGPAWNGAALVPLGARLPYFPFYLPLAWLRLVRILSGADWLHLHLSHGRFQAPTLLYWAACRVKGVPFGLTFQDFNNPTVRRPRRWELTVLGFLVRRARWLTAVSRFTAEQLSASVPSAAGRVVVVPNGFDPEEIGSAALERPGRRGFVLCVARLLLYKGIDILLMAWKGVCEAFGDVDLVLCGPDDSGGYHEQLARRLGLGERVRFVGEKPRAEVLSLLGGCLFFVFPSRHESFGIAALEAMAAGKVVLAARAGGLVELIEDGRDGLVVAAKDVGVLAEGLSRLLRDADLRSFLGSNARRTAQSYRWDRAAKSYLALYAGRA